MKTSLKEDFKELVCKNIKREGIEKLLEWLDNTSFYTDPASCYFHGNYKGGLCEHSLNVYYASCEEYKKVMKKKDLTEQEIESLTIAALFHDLCKVGSYRVEMRNTKQNGMWVQIPYYKFVPTMYTPLGHGTASLAIVQNFIKLTLEEAVAINNHMGAADCSTYHNLENIQLGYKNHPLSYAVATADMYATTFMEEAKGGINVG